MKPVRSFYDARLAQGRQSRSMSLMEATANVVVGYVIAVIAQLVMFPFFGIRVGLTTNLLLGATFMATSMARTYFLRRLFETIRVGRLPRPLVRGLRQ